MPLDIPNTVANDPDMRLRSVKPAVGPTYCRAMANDTVERIAQYEDLDLRPLVRTPQVPIPSKPVGAATSLPGISTTGDPSIDFNPPPNILYGF